MKKISFLVGASFLLFASGIMSQPSSQEELDNALRKEMGQETPIETKKSKKTSQENKEPTEKKAEESDPLRERYVSTEDNGSTLLWILVKISVVLGILVGMFYYVLQYLSKNKIARFPVQGEMKVLSSLSLGPGKELQMVEVSGALLVLGISEHSVQLVKEIDDRNTKEKIFSMRDSYEPPTETFVDYFVNTIKNTNIKKETKKSYKSEFQNEEMDEESFIELQLKQKERLEKLKKERDVISGKNKKDSDFTY